MPLSPAPTPAVTARDIISHPPLQARISLWMPKGKSRLGLSTLVPGQGQLDVLLEEFIANNLFTVTSENRECITQAFLSGNFMILI